MTATSSSNDFGDRLKATIKQQGMTSKQLAEKLRVSPNSVTSWTRGRYRPDHEHTAEIATALGVTIDELHGRAEPAAQPPPGASSPAPAAAVTQAAASTPGAGDAEAHRIVAALAALDLEPTIEAVQRATPPLMEILAAVRRHAAADT